MATEAPYELAVDGARSLMVHVLRGTETLSEPWWFEIVVTSPDNQDLERVALGKRAALILRVADSPRAFYGIVSAVRLEEVGRDGLRKHVLRVVPRLWLLTRKKRTRIFQRMRVTDIVTSVLGEAGIGVAWKLARTYPTREYCTQYEETDERFIRRILAEAGIFFTFFDGGPTDAADALATVGEVVGAVAGAAGASGLVPSALSAAAAVPTFIPGDTLVCADDAAAYAPIGPDDPVALAAASAASAALGVATSLAGPAGSLVGSAVSAVAGALGAGAPLLRVGAFAAEAGAYEPRVARFTLENTVRSSAATFRDYDPDRPLVRLQSTAVSTAPFPPSPVEIAAMAAATAENALSAASSALPSGALSTAAGVVGDVAAAAVKTVLPNEVYEHHAPFLFPKWDLAPDDAPLILRQKRRRASVASGESNAPSLCPGHRFALGDHPAPEVDGEYAVTRVTHAGEPHGSGPDGGRRRVYTNTFECVPASMPYVPARRKRKSVQVALTATVVGPEGDDIHVDARGQIKVQFHWDREPKPNGETSCWLRVMQPWGGASWGAQFIPRVGMEVVVTFEGGDPDKPLVLGSLYNGTHPTAFLLPKDKTRSGWRTKSSPSGEGFNELSFEDRAGLEQIYLHAQRDLDEAVGRDHDTRIGGDRIRVIGGNLTDDTVGSARYRVAKERREEVGEGYSLDIGKSRRLSIGGADQEHVGGSRTTHVEGALTTHVDGTESKTVGSKKRPAASESFVWGTWAVGADGAISLSADQGITLRCGESVVEVTKEGVKINGKQLEIAGSKSVSMAGDGPAITLSDEGRIEAKTLSFVSSKASLVLDEEAKLDGKQVKINCKGIEQSKDDPTKPAVETKKLSVKLLDDAGKPRANKEYLVTAGGARFEGSTDGSGGIDLEVPKTAEVAQIILYAGERPEGEQVRYRIALEDVPPSSEVRGSLIRLRNLGYFWGEPGDVLDAAGIDAILAFQRAVEIELTGALDAATIAKLESTHGH
ncbi:MAG: type VI secretion system tip protein TssI/VgrG [Polyangiaceae bacterium]